MGLGKGEEEMVSVSDLALTTRHPGSTEVFPKGWIAVTDSEEKEGGVGGNERGKEVKEGEGDSMQTGRKNLSHEDYIFPKNL